MFVEKRNILNVVGLKKLKKKTVVEHQKCKNTPKPAGFEN